MVARGEQFVFAQSLRDVAEFIGIEGVGGPTLSPAELVEKLDHVLATAARLFGQIPPEHLGDKLPNRNRSYFELGHHIFRIPEAFLELTLGVALTHESLVVPPGPEQQDQEGVLRYGELVRLRLNAWWEGIDEDAFGTKVPTYYGEQPLHEVLERSTWHPAQHVRQLAMVLESLGIAPERPLGPADLEGLPVPDKVWDS